MLISQTHSYLYEAAALDILVGNIEKNDVERVDPLKETFSYTFHTKKGESGTKEMPLGAGVNLEKNSLYKQMRFLSLFEAKNFILKQVKEAENDPIHDLAKQKDAETGLMDNEVASKMIRLLPAYQEKMARYNGHVELCSKMFECLKKYQFVVDPTEFDQEKEAEGI